MHETRVPAARLAQQLCRTRSLTEDVVQQALLDAWRNLDVFDPARGTEQSWLLGIVRNRSLDALRRVSVLERRRSHEPDAAERVVAPHDTVEHAIAGDRAEAVGRLLATLPEEQRKVVELAYFEGLSHPEISARLDLPLGTVKGRTRLALEKLRERADLHLA